jgi:hypothetical protein
MRPSSLSLVSSISKVSIPSSRPLVHEKGYGEPLAHEEDAEGWLTIKSGLESSLSILN